MYKSDNYYASSQVITVPLEPPGRIIANLCAYPLPGSDDDQMIMSGDIFCACCGRCIPYACVGVSYDGVINVYEADDSGRFRIIIPVNTACIEVTFSHTCFKAYTAVYSACRGEKGLKIYLYPR